MYQQAQYTPTPQFDDYMQQGLQNSGAGNKGLIGGLVNSLLSTYTLGILGDSAQSAASPTVSNTTAPIQQPQGQQGQGLGSYVQNLGNNFQQAYQNANQNSQLGQAANSVGEITGWW